MLAARFRGRKCGSKRLSSPVLEALFFYIKAVPRSDPVPSEPMTSPQKRFCDFPLVELTGTIGYYSMLAGKVAGKGARLEFSRFEPGPFNTCRRTRSASS